MIFNTFARFLHQDTLPTQQPGQVGLHHRQNVGAAYQIRSGKARK